MDAKPSSRVAALAGGIGRCASRSPILTSATTRHPLRPEPLRCAQYNSFVATYHVQNFGCRATQADGEAIERQLLERGLQRASAAEAEVVVLNTCTVTAAADQDARAAIRRIHRANPQAEILVTGCYAQRAPQEFRRSRRQPGDWEFSQARTCEPCFEPERLSRTFSPTGANWRSAGSECHRRGHLRAHGA